MKKILSILLLTATIASAKSLTLMVQNDVFLPFGNHDHFYSNGVRAEYEDTLFGIAAAQYMYTPVDRKSSEIVEGDRPYCGYLYLAGFKNFRHGPNNIYVELQVGTVGEYSYAGKTQNFIHKVIGSQHVNGWDNQINNEFILNGYVNEDYTFDIVDGIFQIIPQAGLSLGNYYDDVHIGVNFKAGYNLLPYDTVHNIEPFVSAKKPTYWSAYAFCKPQFRYVFHNTSLEGSIFHSNESPYTVDIEPMVLDVLYGIGASYKCVDFEFSLISRTDEYKHQIDNGDFGTISVTVNF